MVLTVEILCFSQLLVSDSSANSISVAAELRPDPLNRAVQIAEQTTVRVLSQSSAGSGVIIQKQGGTYTVLTCAHVVASHSTDRRTILTSDGFTHPVQPLRVTRLGDLDLALVKFTSPRFYQVVELRRSDVAIGATVYAAGFPNWRSLSASAIANTRTWGLKAFTIRQGSVGMLLEKPLQEGYQLGYTNDVEDGMSGGPVLNQQGQLVGINGRLKFPFQGISAFVFTDGTLPAHSLFQQMESLSWAIPTSAFHRIAF